MNNIQRIEAVFSLAGIPTHGIFQEVHPDGPLHSHWFVVMLSAGFIKLRAVNGADGYEVDWSTTGVTHEGERVQTCITLPSALGLLMDLAPKIRGLAAVSNQPAEVKRGGYTLTKVGYCHGRSLYACHDFDTHDHEALAEYMTSNFPTMKKLEIVGFDSCEQFWLISVPDYFLFQ